MDAQLGETKIGSWYVALVDTNGSEITGELTVTDRRLYFHPTMNLSSAALLSHNPLLGGALLIGNQSQVFKDSYTRVIGKDEIVSVSVDKGFIKSKLRVTVASGITHVFSRGVMSMDPIVAAIQQR